MFEDILREKALTNFAAKRGANSINSQSPHSIRRRREQLLSSPLMANGSALRAALGDAKANQWVSLTFGSSEPILMIFDVGHFIVYSEDHARELSSEGGVIPATHRLDLQIKLRTDGPNVGKVALDMRAYQVGRERDTIRHTRRLVETCEDAVAFLEHGVAGVILALHGEALAGDEVLRGPGR